MRQTESKKPVNTMMKASFTDTVLITLLQSFGLLLSSLQLAFSSFHFVWSFSVAGRVRFSLESGTKSFCSKVRPLPILTTSFIHRKKREDMMLKFSSLSLSVIFVYPVLIMTRNLMKMTTMTSLLGKWTMN